MKAAVLHAPNQPLTIEEVAVEKPKSREVLLRTAFAGLCHSDLHFIEGLYPTPAAGGARPRILGCGRGGRRRRHLRQARRPCDHLPVRVLRHLPAMPDRSSEFV